MGKKKTKQNKTKQNKIDSYIYIIFTYTTKENDENKQIHILYYMQ